MAYYDEYEGRCKPTQDELDDSYYRSIREVLNEKYTAKLEQKLKRYTEALRVLRNWILTQRAAGVIGCPDNYNPDFKEALKVAKEAEGEL